MRTHPSNPAGNCLPPSTTDKGIVAAIETSGYPLQGIVTAKLLSHGFNASEEWGYIDRDGKFAIRASGAGTCDGPSVAGEVGWSDMKAWLMGWSPLEKDTTRRSQHQQRWCRP
jgi:hypothetical protein